MMSLDEIERATQDSIVARRNMMLGIWAGIIRPHGIGG